MISVDGSATRDVSNNDTSLPAATSIDPLPVRIVTGSTSVKPLLST
jgi:hypothetical protein